MKKYLFRKNVKKCNLLQNNELKIFLRIAKIGTEFAYCLM